MLDRSKGAGCPLFGDCFSDACVARTIVEWYVVMIEAQMNLAVAANAHADSVVFIESRLHIVCERKVLPITQRRVDFAPTEVDMMFAVSRSCLVECDVLIVAKGGQGVLLESKAIETD